jgi:hypothetical protein
MYPRRSAMVAGAFQEESAGTWDVLGALELETDGAVQGPDDHIVCRLPRNAKDDVMPRELQHVSGDGLKHALYAHRNACGGV